MADSSDSPSSDSGQHSSAEAGEDSSDTDNDSELHPGSKKRARYACTFHPETNTFKWAKVSKKGPSFAFCNLCSRNISVAYGGSKDLRKHEMTAVHQTASKSAHTSNSLTDYFHNKSGLKRVESVVQAEVKFSLC